MGEDLASSTEDFLCSGLTELGNNVTLMSPGSITDRNYTHEQIRDYRVSGLTSISGAIAASKILSRYEMKEFDIILVDWRYAYLLRKSLQKLDLPWAIIDRGPPVKKGYSIICKNGSGCAHGNIRKKTQWAGLWSQKSIETLSSA